MIIHCPRCGYSRTPTDSAPTSECPNCKIGFQQWLSPKRFNELASRDPARLSPLKITLRLIALVFFTAFAYFGLVGSAAFLYQIGTCGLINGPWSMHCALNGWQLNAYAVVAGIAWLIYFWMGGAWVIGKVVSRYIVVIGTLAGLFSILPWLLLANQGESTFVILSTQPSLVMLMFIGGPTIVFAAYLARTHWRLASSEGN